MNEKADQMQKKSKLESKKSEKSQQHSAFYRLQSKNISHSNEWKSKVKWFRVEKAYFF